MGGKRKKKTLSASVDPEIYEELQEAARTAGTSKSAVVSSALRLYTSLPPASRRALREAGQPYGDPAFQERVRRELERVLLRSRWDALAEQVDEQLGDEVPPQLSEDELLSAADQAVREARRGAPEG